MIDLDTTVFTSNPHDMFGFAKGDKVKIMDQKFYDQLDYFHTKFKKSARKKRIRQKWINRYDFLNKVREVIKVDNSDCILTLDKNNA